ncbi:transketolase [Selenomonas ruminantium]|uniref:Transketolase n=1 Tax=Selenomonas ruminantium TaxID=971 RepID=A0A1I0YIG1_SELRU|nr:transketolase [Selenomonas ruminantium]SFB12138.1 transketolase [Selenomonas ruminantium]
MGKLLSVVELQEAALNIRRNLLELCARQNIHIGGDLSITDVMTVLWQYQMKYNCKNPRAEERDRFVLSKGHASAVTSFNQAAIGCFSVEDVINEYATDGGRFSMHSCNLVNPYVEVSTGSLGHGFPVACGIAAGLRLKGNHNSRVYVVMGDGEQSEGSVWEAALNAVHLQLGNLVAIVDCNGLEADGSLEEITSLGDIAAKYRALGWNVCELDGHDIGVIKEKFDDLPPVDSRQPIVFICHTVKGKGISFMENQSKWHAGRMTNEQYWNAVGQLEKANT